MGKKRHRSNFVSKGQRPNISKEHLKAARSEVSGFTKAYNKVKAWREGKNPWITIPGTASNMRYIKVRAVNLWGDPKKARGIYTREEANA